MTLFANLPTPNLTLLGTQSYTTDWGSVYCNGTQWIVADLNPSSSVLSFNRDIVYNGVSSPLNSWMYLVQGIHGIAANGPSTTISPFFLDISGDVVDTTTLGAGNLKGMFVQLVPSTGHTGSRETFEASMVIVGAPLTTAGFYVANTGILNCQANLGGALTTYFTTLGDIFAANFNVQASSGATAIRQVTACEFDISVKSGASTAEKLAVTINQTVLDANRGIYDDCALSFPQNDATTVTWKYGISFGNYAHRWSFGSDSTLITAQQRQIGPASNSIALYGVDFRTCTFQTGGAAFISTGFLVDPKGQVVPGSFTVATLPTGIQGGQAFVTDATVTFTAGIGTIVAGTGSNKVPVTYDGTNWRIG